MIGKLLTVGTLILVLLGAALMGCQSAAAPPTAAQPTAAPKPAEKAPPEAKPTSPPAAPAKPAEKAAPAAQPAAPKPLTKLAIVYSVLSGDPVAIWVAKEAKLFEKYGIDAELIYIGGSTKIAQAMLSGDVKIGQGGAAASISGALGGGDFVMVGSLVNVFTFSLFTPQSIKSVAELKGKVVAATAPNTSTDFAGRFALKKNGVDPSEVTFIYSGGTPETLAALKSGGVQGGIIPPPQTLLARDAGFKELVDISQVGVAFVQAPIMTTRSFVKQNPDLVRGFIKAITEGIAMAKQDKTMAKRVLSLYVKSDDNAILEETYQVYVVKAYPKVPYAILEGIKTVLEVMDDPKAKASKPEDFVDNSFVKELEESGFIDKLYK